MTLNKIGFIFLFTCFLFSFTEARDLQKSLSTADKIQLIDPADRQKMEDFFHAVFQNGDFALTLFGNKPMGMVDVVLDQKLLDRRLTTIILGWQIWAKYQHLFPASNYCITSYEIAPFFGLILLNKNRCREIVQKHVSLFKDCFSFQSVEEFVDRLCSPAFLSSVNKDVKNFHLCMGLLLGYGKTSASLFEKRMQLWKEAAQYPYELQGLNEEDQRMVYSKKENKIEKVASLRPSKEIFTELNEMRDQFKFVPMTVRDNPLSLIKINGFVTFGEEPESALIQTENDAIMEKLLEINYSDHFLEIILNKLTE